MCQSESLPSAYSRRGAGSKRRVKHAHSPPGRLEASVVDTGNEERDRNLIGVLRISLLGLSMDHLRYRHCGENSPALPNQLSALGARPGPLRFAPYLRLVSPCLPCTEVPSYVKCKVICIQERLLLRLHLPGACFLSTLSPRPLHYQVSPGHASTENIFTHPSIPLASGTSHSLSLRSIVTPPPSRDLHEPQQPQILFSTPPSAAGGQKL